MKIIIFAERGGVKRYIEFFNEFYAYETIFPSSNGNHGNRGRRGKKLLRCFFIPIDEVDESLR
jgi:hypothetical protein